MTRHPYVHEAEIELRAGVDPRAVGAAVTVALCGHWEHEGPCRWPHNNQTQEFQSSEFRLQIGESQSQRLGFRTLFVCEPEEEPEVRAKIRAALHESRDWRVLADRERPIAATEQELAGNLLLVPRRV
ncbi:MAG: hypothetical protein U0Q55_21105 [Vicinamibacterales bacterium]